MGGKLISGESRPACLVGGRRLNVCKKSGGGDSVCM